MTFTRLAVVGPDPAADPAVAEAARLLRAGEIVAFPTETVYGLGADAGSEAAVQRVFDAKGRPADNPLIVHVASADDLRLVSPAVPEAARVLARAFWPGPLTLVLPARPELRRAASRGLDTVAVRVPDHPVALALLRAAGIPVAAPSANRSGRPSPTRAGDVLRDLGDRVPLVLDGGPCRVGLESTVLDLTTEPPAILRPGAIGSAEIEAVLGRPLAAATDGASLSRSPGTRHRHYRPEATLVLLGARVGDEAALRLARSAPSCAYVGRREALLRALSRSTAVLDDAALARDLYALLRDLDAQSVQVVLADRPEPGGLRDALRDRLSRAASHVVETDEDAEALSVALPPGR